MTADRLGCGVVFDLLEAADSAGEDDVAHAHKCRTSPGEITPLDRTVGGISAADDVLEEVHAVDPQVEGVAVVAECGAQLAHSIGDVPITFISPTDDEPDELVRIVPVGESRERVGVGGGEAEARVGLDEPSLDPVVEGVPQAGHDRGQVDARERVVPIAQFTREA